jgi:acyl dehydratase
VRYFEDFREGETVELGEYEVTEGEILAFARMYDPQPFHVDPAAAARSPFGGLIASGWHTASMFMRLWVDGLLSETASMGSPGVEQLRWLVPVRPGDVLRGRVTVLETAPSQTRPDRGTLITESQLVNQRDEIVMTMRGRGFVARRA